MVGWRDGKSSAWMYRKGWSTRLAKCFLHTLSIVAIPRGCTSEFSLNNSRNSLNVIYYRDRVLYVFIWERPRCPYDDDDDDDDPDDNDVRRKENQIEKTRP